MKIKTYSKGKLTRVQQKFYQVRYGNLFITGDFETIEQARDSVSNLVSGFYGICSYWKDILNE